MASKKITLVASKRTVLEEKLTASVKMAKNGDKFEELFPVDLPPGVRMNKKTGEFILPLGAAERADLLYNTRELRLSVQRRLEKLETLENELKEYFVNTLPKSNSKGISGMTANVTIKPKPIPQVADWDKFYSYVRKNNAFELLQRRLSEDAVKERLEEAGKRGLPGVVIFNAQKVSCVKL